MVLWLLFFHLRGHGTLENDCYSPSLLLLLCQVTFVMLFHGAFLFMELLNHNYLRQIVEPFSLICLLHDATSLKSVACISSIAWLADLFVVHHMTLTWMIHLY